MRKNALISGGSQRIGAAIVKALHQKGFTIYLHFGQNREAAQELQKALNKVRENSCHILSCDLSEDHAPKTIANWLLENTQELDLLVNNASVFYETPWESACIGEWQKLFTINSQTPFFLSQALLPALKRSRGQVINLIDIHVERTLEDHPIYCASKAALKSLTLSLAKDLKGQVRCNGISPGAILWPEQEGDLSLQSEIIQKIPQGHLGDVKNISDTVLFLVENQYINGQIINVDGGRTLHS
ncbi:MAG: SDR family oxidoreductase [Bermanella sp.]